MATQNPTTDLRTHQVFNQPPLLQDYNLFTTDLPLQAAMTREGSDAPTTGVEEFGDKLGRADTLLAGRQASESPPMLQAFDRFGHRINEVRFHPAYHQLMALGKEAGITGLPWDPNQRGGHVLHAGLQYLLTQVEPGVCCPLCMTYAAVPTLAHSPSLSKAWTPGLLSPVYDPRSLPAPEKKGLTLGMAMTEKQGGSDVRANSTSASPIDSERYELTGHKWFCSAPMSDGFLTLAKTKNGLSCFLVPRWRPDGSRNTILLQRLKDKLGNRSNASGEIEYDRAFATLLGEEGRGVNTIIEMVHHTRLDTMVAATGLMRAALLEAVHHATYRETFGRRLRDHPLMRNVLADLALEVEAAVALSFRVARAYDQSSTSADARLLARLGVAVGKYWTNKRAVPLIGEALECLGGAGYVEEGPLPRLYREAPLNGIWEGSGNVICLDILRGIQREPGALELLLADINLAAGANPHLDAARERLEPGGLLGEDAEVHARRTAEFLATTWQASLLVRSAPAPIADAFCQSRLGSRGTSAFGTLESAECFSPLLERAAPEHL